MEQFPFRHDRGYLIDRQEHDIVAAADGYPFEKPLRGIGIVMADGSLDPAGLATAEVRCFESFAGAAKRLLEPGAFDGFEQVIDRVEFEGADGISAG